MAKLTNDYEKLKKIILERKLYTNFKTDEDTDYISFIINDVVFEILTHRTFCMPNADDMIGDLMFDSQSYKEESQTITVTGVYYIDENDAYILVEESEIKKLINKINRDNPPLNKI